MYIILRLQGILLLNINLFKYKWLVTDLMKSTIQINRVQILLSLLKESLVILATHGMWEDEGLLFLHGPGAPTLRLLLLLLRTRRQTILQCIFVSFNLLWLLMLFFFLHVFFRLFLPLPEEEWGDILIFLFTITAEVLIDLVSPLTYLIPLTSALPSTVRVISHCNIRVRGKVGVIQSILNSLLSTHLWDVLEAEIFEDKLADIVRILQFDEVAFENLQHVVLFLP
jgi:hypothetical protein